VGVISSQMASPSVPSACAGGQGGALVARAPGRAGPSGRGTHRRTGAHVRARGLIAAALLPAAASAQVIGGRVVDAATQRPVARTLVRVRVDTGALTVVSGRDGAFVLALPRAGRYQLQFFPDAGAAYLSDSLDVAPDAFVERAFPLALRPDPVYADFQVDRQAAPRPGQAGPRYPAALRRKHVNGAVLATYVVDTTGRVRPGSFTVLEASDTAFVSAVAASVAATKYVPAERGGRKVPQLVRHPVEFCVSKSGSAVVDATGQLGYCSR
jgi:hypothetical protein